MQYMKRSILSIVMFAMAAFTFGQASPISAGFHVGGSNYLGEIGGKLAPRASVIDANIITTSPSVGIFLRYASNDRVRISGEVNYVHIRQSDANAEDPARQARNLNFRNRMFEFGFRSDFTVFSLSNRQGLRNYTRPGRLSFKVFVFTGCYGVLHNPQAQVTHDPNNEWGDYWYDFDRYAQKAKWRNTEPSSQRFLWESEWKLAWAMVGPWAWKHRGEGRSPIT